MTKAELVAKVAVKTQMTHQQTAQVVDLLLASIVKAPLQYPRITAKVLA